MANTANTVGWLVYKITGDASLLYKELDKVTNELEETSDSFDALSKSVRSFATKVLTGVLVKALADTASRMEELESKFETVFGDLARESEAWAANYSEAVNRGQLATMEFMATIQDIQTGYGMAVDEAARFSQAVVGITNDLASFSNIRFDEAMAAMQSGLAQEFEALRRLGVGISVEIINQGEYASALGKTWDAREAAGNTQRSREAESECAAPDDLELGGVQLAARRCSQDLGQLRQHACRLQGSTPGPGGGDG